MQKLSAAPRPTRPRSWWSCESPNRSACCTTITVALGTSIPTSITVVATSTSTSPAANARITASFSSPGICPWRSASRSSGKTSRAAARTPRWPSGAPPSPTPPPAGRPGTPAAPPAPARGRRRAPSPRSPAAERRPHRLSAGGTLVEHGEIEVAVERQRERAGDGGGRHHQHVGLLAELRSASRCRTPKRCCSSTTARPSRWYSTDSWISACVPTTSCASPLPMLPAPRAAPPRAGRPVRSRPRTGRSPSSDRRVRSVLLRQDLRGRHQRRLVAVLHGAQHREERDHRLPGSHVPLEEAVHPPRSAPCRCRSRGGRAPAPVSEGERVEERAQGAALGGRRSPGRPRRCLEVGARVQELEEEELVEGEAAAPGLRLLERGGPVQHLQRTRQRRELGASQQLLRERLVLLRRAEQAVQVVGEEAPRWLSPSVAG
jgi:hypothetical protein